MGAYLFANQYQNEVIPASEQTFKPEWVTFYEEIPKTIFNFIVIDPALSEAATADYTGVVVCSVDVNGTRYIRYAKRHKVNPSQLIDLIFELNDVWSPLNIGIEEVAFQKAILYFIDAEMKRRRKMLPITGIKAPTDRTKEMRILSLVPWFQWGRILMAQGLTDLESEMMSFPRGAHDDLLDCVAYIDSIAVTPTEVMNERRPSSGDPEYEKWFIQQVLSKGKPERFDPEIS